MEFREIKTREEFIKILSVIRQDWGEDFGSDDDIADNFQVAQRHHYRQFAAYDGDKVIAVTGMTKGFIPVSKNPVYDLSAFVVDEAYRSKGIGSKLIAFCKNVAAEDSASYLRTGAYTHNYKAQAFYQKNGFKHTANFMCHKIDGESV